MKQIGDWIVEKEIGVGATGAVYLARHKSVGSEVAVKALLPLNASNREVREGFLQEARAQVSLRHNNIARVFDFVEEGQQYFIVMEHLPGGSLRDYLTRNPGPLPFSQALRWAKQLLEALYYAYRQGVIHRHIKPSNLLLDENGQMKVADFGVALVLNGRRLMITGMSVRTTEYMSPEQVINPVVTDHRADIYSIGVVLYEMLTGRVPFMKGDDFEAMPAREHEATPSPRRFNPAIPPQLEQIVLRALAKDRDSRYSSCGEFARAIEAFERGETVVQQQEKIRRFLKVVEERDCLNGAFDGAGFTRSNGAVNAAARSHFSNPLAAVFAHGNARRRAPKPLWLTLAAAALLFFVFMIVAGTLLTRGESESRMDRYYALRSGLEHEGSWPQVESKYRDKIRQEPQNGLWYGMLIESLFRQARYKDAEIVAREAMVMEPKEGLWPDLLGDALKMQGNKSEAEVAYRQAMRLATDKADLQVYQGDLWSLLENWAAAEIDYGEAVRLNPNRPLIHVILGDILAMRKKWVEAESAMREAIRQTPNNSQWRSSLGRLFSEQEKWAEAEAAYREAIRINPSNAEHHNDLAWALVRMKRDAEADAEIAKAIQLAPGEARYHNSLGNYYYNRGVWPRAEAEYREAVRIKPDTADYRANLGWTLLRQGKAQGAEAEFARAIALDVNNAYYRDGRGSALMKLSRYQDAAAEYREAARLKPDSSSYHNQLGVALGWLRNFSEAAAEFREASRLDPNNKVARSNLRKVS